MNLAMSKREAKVNLFKNIISMVMLQAGNFLVPIVTLPYLSRTLHVRNFGIYSFSLAVMVALGVLIEWGFPLCATADVSRERNHSDALSVILRTTIAAKACLTLISFLVLVFLICSMKAFYEAKYVLICAFGLVLAYGLNLGWFLQGMERMSIFSIGSLGCRLMTIPGILLSVHRPDDVWIAALIQSLAAIGGSIVSIILVRRMGYLKLRLVSFEQVWNRLVDARHFFLAAAAINVYTASSVIIIGLTCDPSIVAVYAGADRIKSASQNVISPISQVFFPRSVRKFSEDRDGWEKFVQILMISFGIIGLFISICLFLFAPEIVYVLLGPDFYAAVSVLRILSVIPLVSSLSNVMSIQAMVPLGLSSVRSRILISITIFSIPTAYFCSLHYNYYGSALVVVSCELSGAFLFWLITRREVELFKFNNLRIILFHLKGAIRRPF